MIGIGGFHTNAVHKYRIQCVTVKSERDHGVAAASYGKVGTGQHIGSRDKSDINMTRFLCFIEHFNLLVGINACNGITCRIGKPRIGIIAIGKAGGDVIAIQHHRRKTGALCRDDTEGDLSTANDTVCTQQNSPFATIQHRHCKSVFFEPNLCCEVFSYIFCNKDKLVALNSELFYRNNISTNHKGFKMIT